MSGRPGANSRGRGGKFKIKRGGGRHFTDVQARNADGDVADPWSADAVLPNEIDDDEDSDGEEDSDTDQDDDSDNAPSGGAHRSRAVSGGAPSDYVHIEQPGPQLGQSREELKAAKKARKDAAKKKAMQAAVQVGDMPSSESDDDVDQGYGANPAPPKGILKNKNERPLASTKMQAGTKPFDQEDDLDVDSDEDEDVDAKLASELKKKAMLSRKPAAVAVDEVEALEKKRHPSNADEKALGAGFGPGHGATVAAALAEEQANLERLRIIREEREQREAYLRAEREEVEAKNKARQERTEALLKKAQENKVKGKKKSKK